MLPGHSANTRGRPKGSLNMLTLFNQKRDEKVSLKVDGKTVKMTRQEAWVTNMWNKAIACDPKASAMVLAIMRAAGQLDPGPGEAREIGEDEARVLAEFIARMSGKEPDNG
jgi:hypothetical protein